MVEIKTYKGQEATFYIQAKGLNAGRPLKTAIPNCFAVTTSIENAYEIVYSVWRSKRFEREIRGSVIPFITITAVKGIVIKALQGAADYDQKILKSISSIDDAIANYEKQIELLKDMRTLMSKKAHNGH